MFITTRFCQVVLGSVAALALVGCTGSEEPGGSQSGESLGLVCEVSDSVDDALCDCAAEMVCSQIYYCLSADEIEARSEWWHPYDRCVAEVAEDCKEDLTDDDYYPSDFSQCVRDIGAASCEQFGAFDSLSGSFPASCESFNALNSALNLPD